ncbi:MFS transporter [Peribacillus psychrosaccharolyticus]|uniref:MFS transporter n=1 Tax=Peribacillus psychrosaccharolyticus TaxID=1407 RepID=A0A974NPK2_PERPY|nr:MFS transporter [Peribacillus psychrosaccharolyticus]MEC2053910.1 MFS transporter [Peribacillus psychrosaccharolyticus]MED3742476.1 MFS transporter [Peribacillus psychrosaccharolyticus]QQT01433.1 MFS transporter [Peribacillus psychrosaccharolyticus]
MAKAKGKKTWIVVFVSCFLGLMVDGMDLQMLSLTMPALMDEFNITKTAAGVISTWSLMGMALGGIMGGWLSDRYGRVKMAAWMMVLFSIGTAALGFAQTYEQFIVIRFISAVGIGAEYSICTMLMAEYVPTKKRTTILGTLQAAYSVGYLIAALLAGAILPVYGWRPLYFIAVVPVILALYIRYNLPEPEGWREEVKKRKAAKVNKNEWATLFTNPKTRNIFLFWILTSTFLQFGYYGLGSWLPTYLVSELGFAFTKMTGYLIGTYSAMILGKIITGWLADKFGRKTMYIIGGLSTGLCLPIVYLYNTPGNIIALLTILGFLYGMPYAVNSTYMSESFPTNIRGTAVGGAYNIGRIGAAMAPMIIGVIAESKSIGFGLASLGIAYALAGIIPAIFIKEKMYDPFTNAANNQKPTEMTSTNYTA